MTAEHPFLKIGDLVLLSRRDGGAVGRVSEIHGNRNSQTLPTIEVNARYVVFIVLDEEQRAAMRKLGLLEQIALAATGRQF